MLDYSDVDIIITRDDNRTDCYEKNNIRNVNVNIGCV